MRLRWLLGALACAAVAGCSGGPTASPGPAASSASAGALDVATDAAAIDAILERAWADKGLSPTPEIDDATYLRRVTIDLVGRVPRADEVSAFLADPSPDKRARAVERLLASPEHDRHLARRWEAILLGAEVKRNVVDRSAFRRYLERRFAEGAGWDAIVRDIVTAEGTTSVGGKIGPAMVDGDTAGRGDEERAAGINGAANYFLRFARSPQDLAGQTSRAFLGVQIQCAQCHDHKTEAWKQADFRSFASALGRVRIEPVDRTRGSIGVFEVADADRMPRRLMKDEEVRAIAQAPARALDGTDLSSADDTRAALAAWMTSSENPWFSRAIANRTWADLFGAGLVDPVDDLRPSNAAVLPEALDALAEGFERSGFSLDYLYRTLTATKAYTRSVGPGVGSQRTALFSRAGLRPLSSDELLESIFAAAEVDRLLEEKAPQRAEDAKALLRRRLRFVFEDDAESNADAYDGTLQQALFSMNGILPVAATTLAPGTVLERAMASGDEAAVRELFLRTLSRPPTEAELRDALAFLERPRPVESADAEEPRRLPGRAGRLVPPAALRSRARTDRERGYEDLFWTLLNASEFQFRR
jgi:hypothetical protein